MGRIEFDFYSTTMQANRLEEIANEIEKISNKKIDETLKNISNNWKSQTASAFIIKGNQVQNQITTSADDLAKVSQRIKKVAKQVYQAELKAKEIATNRTAR